MKLLIFDLDGTLIDSGADIASSMNQLLETMGRASLPIDLIRSFVGNGASKLVERAMPGLVGEEIDEAVAAYLEIYRARLLDTTRPYPGAREALEALAGGHELAVLTNKPLRESLLILEGLDLARFFFAVYGGDSFRHRKPDPVGVETIRREAGVATAETIFVGDTEVDLETARRAGVPCCLVSYASSLGRTRGLEPDFLVSDLRELVSLANAGVAG